MRAATRQDAPRIAEIHMAAFGPNAMLHAQFPTPAIRQGLQISIENKALADIDDPKTTVLVVTIHGKGYHLLLSCSFGGRGVRCWTGLLHRLGFKHYRPPEAQSTL